MEFAAQIKHKKQLALTLRTFPVITNSWHRKKYNLSTVFSEVNDLKKQRVGGRFEVIFLHPNKHARRMDFKLMRYFILIFKSYELTCCRTCSKGLVLETAEELCCHFSSQKKPCFSAGALRALWTVRCDRYLTLARTVEMSVTHTSVVLGTKPASTDMLVLVAFYVWCLPGQPWGTFLWYATVFCQSADWTCW